MTGTYDGAMASTKYRCRIEISLSVSDADVCAACGAA